MIPPLNQEANAPEAGLPETSTYDADLHASICRGLADAEAGRLISIENLMKEFNIEE